VKQQWYVNDPEDGISLHDSEDEARAAAREVLSDLAEYAGDGWPENMDDLHWGRIQPVQIAAKVNERPAPEGSEFDTLCEYVLKDVTA
jgi:hypothetical protein